MVFFRSKTTPLFTKVINYFLMFGYWFCILTTIAVKGKVREGQSMPILIPFGKWIANPHPPPLSLNTKCKVE